MRIDDDILKICQHKNRGLVTIYERYDPQKGGLNEYFINEMAKQLTQHITTLLKWNNKETKRRLELSIAYGLTYTVQRDLYFHIYVGYSGGLSTFMWVMCRCQNTQIEHPDPYDDNNDHWQFTIIDRLESHVEDVIRCQPDGLVYYEDWVGLLTAFYGPSKTNITEKSHYSFEHSIECGWPDVLIRLYMKKPVTTEIKEHALTLLAEFLQSWNEEVERRGGDEVIHDMFLHENDDGEENDADKERLIIVFVDFGNADPSILEHLLRYINDSNLNIKRIAFT